MDDWFESIINPLIVTAKSLLMTFGRVTTMLYSLDCHGRITHIPATNGTAPFDLMKTHARDEIDAFFLILSETSGFTCFLYSRNSSLMRQVTIIDGKIDDKGWKQNFEGPDPLQD